MSIKLKDIYFGRADGLLESEDDNFESLFYTGNDKYNQLCTDKKKFIISGRKGTGKTILAKYFEKEMIKNKKPTKTLTKREFVLHSLIEKGKFNLNEYDYGLFMEYIILSEFGKLILENKKMFLNWKSIFRIRRIIKKLEYLDEILKQRISAENFQKVGYSRTLNNSATTCVSSGIEMKGVSVKGDMDCSSGEQLQEEYQKNPYYNILDNLKRTVFDLMKWVPCNIIFDDLDELDERIDENAVIIKFLIEFLETSNRLNLEMKKNGIEDSRVIILIRSDIVDILNQYSTNLNKILVDSEIRLNWIKKIRSKEIHPLLDLIVTKIQNSNPLLKDKSKGEIIKQFFPKTINGIPFVDHMLNSSFGRPRDLINMLNIIKNEYPDKEKFYADSFVETQQEYSNTFSNELRNELATHYEPAKIQEGFDILHYISKKSFWLSDVRKVFEEHSLEITRFDSEEEFINMAYAYGMIGNVWKEDDKSKSSYSWKYREDGYEKPDFQKKFFLHIGLRKKILN